MFAAAALLVSVILLIGARSASALTVDGVPVWMASAAERSLAAVYEHIDPSSSVSTKEELLRLVVSRLLRGYEASKISFADGVRVSLVRKDGGPAPRWRVVIAPPELSPPISGWFASDVDGLSGQISDLLADASIDAMTWADVDLKAAIDLMIEDRLPGWRASLLARTEDDSEILEVALTPEQPLALAVSPQISSSSIPVMLHSTLKEGLLKGLSPVIGVPVAWLEVHSGDLAMMTADVISGDYIIDKGKVVATVTPEVGQVSTLDIELESKRYSAWVWMGAYAGAQDRYPEIGVRFGRGFRLIPGWDMELYGELITQIDNFSIESRVGVGWTPFRGVWIGGEWSSSDDLWWLRARYDQGRRFRPYAWLRASEGGDLNAAVGLRLTDHLSIEILYDSRFGDQWNARALVNM